MTLSNSIDSSNIFGDGIGSVEYVQHMGSDLTIVNSARVSFGKEKLEIDDKDKKLIKYLASHRHTSTFEHVNITDTEHGRIMRSADAIQMLIFSSMNQKSSGLNISQTGKRVTTS